ncbi:MAG: acetate kinase [Candidatus Sumerlaeia bacterium]
MKVLVMNCGSSSVKFQLIETSLERIEQNTEIKLAIGQVEKIGMSASIIKFQAKDKPAHKSSAVILEHYKAIEKILELLTHPELGVIRDKGEIEAVGHRIVHGGELFTKSTLINDEVLEHIRECIELAPLHNPANILGYEITKRLLPGIPHAAIFDTSFHQSMPDYAYLYGLPYILYKRHAIRRYGFHGTSHRYLTFRLERLLGKKREFFKNITVHLGNGCSIAAVRFGKSVDTSMGFTPLEGLLMGTRCGDLDPAVVLHIMSKEEIGLHETNTLLNKHSGLIGVADVSNDMRELIEEMNKGNDRARLAIDMFCYRLKKYIAAYIGVLEGADAIAFTGGIGENAALVRAKAVAGLECMGVKIDPELNEAMKGGKEGEITAPGAAIRTFVVPTDEELVIARDTVRCIEGVI